MARFEKCSALHDRVLFAAKLDRLEEWPGEIDESVPDFGLFLALDARPISDGELLKLARQALAQGLVFLCAWGPDCERVHDSFDIVRDEGHDDDSDDDSVVMTSWHDDEPLEEALWFAIFTQYPAGKYLDNFRSLVAASVGNEKWAREIRAALIDPHAFEKRVLASDDPAESAD
jgi:hypothetical protein